MELTVKKQLEKHSNLHVPMLSVAKYLDKKDSMKPLPKLLDGVEIMELLSIKASPKLGRIINALKEEQLSGNINTKEEAVKFVKLNYS